MEKIVRLSVFSLFFTLAAFGQIVQNQNNSASLNDLSFFVNLNNTKYTDAEGSRYINDKFIPAKINQNSKLYPVRFDAVENIMEFKENDNEIKGISPTRDYRITLSDGSKRIYTSNTVISESGDLQRLFLEEVKTSQKYSLYRQERIKFFPGKPAKSSYEPEVPPVFKKLNDVFLVDYPGDDIDYLLIIPKNKKKAKTFFGEKSAEVLKYVKKEGLKLDSKADLIKIFDFYSQL